MYAWDWARAIERKQMMEAKAEAERLKKEVDQLKQQLQQQQQQQEPPPPPKPSVQPYERWKPKEEQRVVPIWQETFGKSLQSLFANRSIEDILPRFTVNHLFNPNSPFQQALRQRGGEPIVSIQPYPNPPLVFIQPVPNPSPMPTPQGMRPEDMITLYAMGFRDSLMRISPILASRGIPIFGNL